MNTLKDNTNMTGAKPKPKTPLKKEELEKIAAELKKKLSRASVTAKQQLSPTNIRTASSPIKGNFTPCKNVVSSPALYSPSSKSPTKMNPSYLLSPVNGESPTKKRKSLPLKSQGIQMVLEPISRPRTPTKEQTTLKPSLDDKKVTTPTLPKKELTVTMENSLLKTPKSKLNYNDEEGAGLLMYLATSPSPAKPYFTPRHSSSLPTTRESSSLLNKNPPASALFIAPPPPVTPKRHFTSSTRTPQNRLTPGMNLYSNLGGLPSQGLTLTPTGFNMNDYVDFFTPSPGGEVLQKSLLKTPDFNNLMNSERNER
jgi:hypothetical protein